MRLQFKLFFFSIFWPSLLIIEVLKYVSYEILEENAKYIMNWIIWMASFVD